MHYRPKAPQTLVLPSRELRSAMPDADGSSGRVSADAAVEGSSSQGRSQSVPTLSRTSTVLNFDS